MKSTLRSRLFFNGLVIVLVGMGLSGLLFWQAAESLYLQSRAENMLAQAELTAKSLQGQALPDQPAETYSQVSNVMPGTHTRLIGPEGAVIIGLPVTASAASLQMPPAEDNAMVSPQDLLKRPEIQSALTGKPSTAIRTVLNGTRRVMYAAAPVTSENGSIRGVVYLAEPLPLSGLPAGFILQLLAILLAAAALALTAGLMLSSRITRPVQEVIHAADRVSAGDLDRSVSTGSGIRELDTLGTAFNRMVASLKRSDHAQQAFVADVAHELRTPLTVIKGTVETLEDGAWDDRENRGRLTSSMQLETDRLIRLVNDLLVLTRADAGLLNLSIHAVDLAVLARLRFEHFAPVAAQNNVSFHIEANGATRVCGDADRLTRVLDNLLDNALRYSPAGGVITIRISDGGSGTLQCAVHDDGAGIPAESLPRIFDRFFRVENSRRKHGGEAGLGLSIVRSLVEAQGGSISAESAPGQGTTLTFRLPASLD